MTSELYSPTSGSVTLCRFPWISKNLLDVLLLDVKNKYNHPTASASASTVRMAPTASPMEAVKAKIT